MIQTAMVGRQPEKSAYRIRGGTLQIELELWHNDLSINYHNTVKDFNMALCIQRQVEAGIDILSEGEGFRDDYWQYILESMGGVEKVRNRYWKIISKPEITESFLGRDWAYAQHFTTKPVKITIPGPLTLASYVEIGTSEFNKETLTQCFSELINEQIKDAVAQGCKHVQVDDPQLAFQTDTANDYGIQLMGQCFDGVPDNVNKYLHVCRGYPNGETFSQSTNRATEDCYLKIMPFLDKSPVNIISIENAFHPNSGALFEMVENKTLMLGVINIKSNRIETPEEIRDNVEIVRRIIPDSRLIMAPDCGCACSPEAFRAKMHNLGKVGRFYQRKEA